MGNFVIKGHWKMTLYDGYGNVKTTREGDNVICTNGKEFLASYLYSGALAASTFTMKYVAIGTDATAEAAANTALGTEVARHTGTVAYASNCIYRVIATFGTGLGTGAIAEYGIFSSSTGGTMLNRDTEAVINKGASDVLAIQVDVTIS